MVIGRHVYRAAWTRLLLLGSLILASCAYVPGKEVQPRPRVFNALGMPGPLSVAPENEHCGAVADRVRLSQQRSNPTSSMGLTRGRRARPRRHRGFVGSPLSSSMVLTRSRDMPSADFGWARLFCTNVAMLRPSESVRLMS